MSTYRTTRLLLSVVPALVFIAVLNVILANMPLHAAPAQGDFAGGNGTAEDPYLVATTNHLDNVRNHLDAHFRQTADINVGVAPFNEGEGWQPIGDAVTPFTGSFDGNRHVIYNLTIDRPSVNYQGLFGYLSGAAVQDVYLENVNIRGGQYTGGLAGRVNNSILEHLRVTGALHGVQDTAGLVGWMGGGSRLAHAASMVTVQGGECTSGLVGYVDNAADTIYHAYTLGTIDGGLYTGGLVGRLYRGVIADSYSRAAVNGSHTVGGAVGYVNLSSAHVYRTYSAGAITAANTTYLGGLVGRSSGTVADSYWDVETSGLAVSAGGVGKTTAEMQQQATFTNYNFYTLWQIDEGHDYPVFQELSNYAQPQPVNLADLEGDGTSDSPYLIANAHELNAIRQALTATFQLANDIDLAATVVWDNGRGWLPIGNTATPFTGTLDGAGYTIYNLTVNRPGTTYQGFFGYLDSATVANLRLENVSVQGGSYTGGFAGRADGSVIENIHLTGEINGGIYTGGLVGYLGGGSSVSYASSSATVRGGSSTGGLVGFMSNTSDSIYHAYTLGTVSGGNDTGGLVGSFYHGILSDSYSQTETKGGSRVGGAVGWLRYSTAHVYQSYSVGVVTGTTSVGGLVGSSSGMVADSYWDVETSGLAVSAGGMGKTTAEMQQRETFTNYNFYTLWQIDEGYGYPVFQELSAYAQPQSVNLADLEGDGTSDSPYLIANAHELNAMRQALTATFQLANDINLATTVVWNNGRGWLPIGNTATPFTGTLDGAGYTIHNLTVNRPGITYQGFFGYLDSATVANLHLENVSVQGGSYTGGLAGLASGGVIENVHLAGGINGGIYTGGLVGYLGGGSSVSYASSSATVRGGSSTGGLVGFMSNASDSIYHAYTLGTVSGGNDTGGLVGSFYHGILSDSYSQTETKGGSRVGGAVGWLRYSTAHVYQSYSVGVVTGTTSVGGLVGSSSGMVANSYWDTETSGLDTSAGGVGKTTVEMQQRATFVNYNFYNLWQIDEDHDYPVFQASSGYARPQPVDMAALDGDGTTENPYLITSADELYAIRQALTATFQLANDINLAATVDWDAGQGWQPIGSATVGQRFAGSFDGAGYTLYNLTVNRPGTTYQGLFGYLDSATVENLRLENVSVRGSSYTGGLAGQANNSVIENVHVTGEINGGTYTGGLLGAMSGGSNVNHVSSATTTHGGSRTGGLVGDMSSASDTIYHAYTLGTVSGSGSVGGLVGYINSGLLADSYTRADVDGGSGNSIGGAVGYMWFSSAQAYRVYSTGVVTSTGSSVGGFLGGRSTNYSQVVVDCYWDTESSGLATSVRGTPKTTAEMQQRPTFVNYNFYNLWQIDENHDYPVFQALGGYAGPQPIDVTTLDGDGTMGNPYLITNADELYAIRQVLTATYRLANDIDLAAAVIWDNGRGWLPIGASTSGQRFTGRLDGADHTIRNLTVNRPGTTYQGLFGYLDGATVENLRLENVSVQGSSYTGGLAGQANNSVIENVHVTGEINGGTYTGGLLGAMSGGSSVNHASSATTTRGGLRTGGLVGDMSSASDIIYHAYTLGTVSGSGSVGGLVGYINSGLLADSYTRADVDGGTGNSIGGAVGYMWFSSAQAYRVYSTGVVTSTGSIGGFLGGRSTNYSQVVVDCYWDTESSGLATSVRGTPKTTAEMQQQATFVNYNFHTLWQIDENHDYPIFQTLSGYAGPQAVDLADLTGDGTPGNPYLITTADELHAMRQALTATFQLANNIDLAATVDWDVGEGWQPIGSATVGQRFTGSFDGAGYTLYNLTVNRPGTTYQGLFGYLDSATVENLRLENVSVRGSSYTGGLAGQANNSVIENVHVTGEINGGTYTGGLLGAMSGGSSVNHVSSATTTRGGSRTGGLVGDMSSASDTIYHAYTLGTVSGSGSVGGLVGYINSGLLADSYTRADVDGGTGNSIGGAVGYMRFSSAQAYRVYSTGVVTSTGSIGGFLGGRSTNYSQVVVDCYWDTESSGLATSVRGTPKTTAEMQQEATFNNWDFVDVWGIVENATYPYHLHTPGAIALTPNTRTHRNGASAEYAIAVTANVTWTAVTNDPWITLTGTTAGIDNGVISYTLAANPAPDLREGSIIIVSESGDITRTFTVRQTAVLNITPQQQTHDAGLSSGHTIGVSGNVTWTAQTDTPWLTITAGDSGADAGAIVYRLEDNFALTPREGEITISGGEITHIFTVTQKAAIPSLSLAPPNRWHRADAAAGQEIMVTANITWTAVTTDAWITLSNDSGSGPGLIAYSVAANMADHLRTGTIIVNGGGLTRTFTVRQATPFTIMPLSRSHDAGPSAGHTIEISGHAAWTAQTTADWVVFTAGQSGSDRGTVVYRLEENLSLWPRAAEIAISGNGLTRIFTVQQAGAQPYLSLSPEQRHHSWHYAADHALTVEANTAWTAVATTDWITITNAASGIGNGVILYSLAANEAPYARLGHILVSDGDKVWPLRVHQALAWQTAVFSNDQAAGTVSGGGYYGHGEPVMVTAVPQFGYHFVDWQEDGLTVFTDTIYAFTAWRNYNLTATFDINIYTLTYLAGPNGDIDGQSVITQSVAHGSDGDPVTAVPNTGYYFEQWSDGATANPRTDLNVMGDLTVTAQFALGVPPLITSPDNAMFEMGVMTTFTITTSGVPTPTINLSGTLPAGVVFTDLGNGTAILSGAAEPDTDGIYHLIFTADNLMPPDDSQTFTLTVPQAPTITSPDVATFALQEMGVFIVTATGVPTPSLTYSGTLPAGLTFTDNGDGTADLTGTPTEDGFFALTFTAANGITPNAVQTFTLTVTSPPAILSPDTAVFTVGETALFTVTTSGIPTPALSYSGALPAGLTFTDNGDGTAALSGTPDAGAGGVYALTFTADNDVLPVATQAFTLTVNEAPAITSPNEATFAVGAMGTFTVTAVGHPLPALSYNGSLPAGLTFTDNGDGTATLSGVTDEAGVYDLVLTAANSILPNDTQTFTLTVTHGPIITSPAETFFITGQPGAFTITASGLPTPTISYEGPLPSGLAFSNNGDGTATLNGTPAAGTAGVYVLLITASNGIEPDAIQTLTIVVNTKVYLPLITNGSP